jgi:hypothetical protein
MNRLETSNSETYDDIHRQRGCGYRDARKLAGFWKVRTSVLKVHGPL